MLCEKRSLAFFLGSNNNFVISWYNTLEWISLVGWFLAFLCHCAAYLSVNLLTQAAKMPFDIFSSLWVLFFFFLPFILQLFLSSSAIKLCHCLLPAWGGWSQVGGYLNDLVCSDSTILFHCRSLCLISLMDYEQGNKNRGRQSENDLTPCKGPAGNWLPTDK